MINTAQSLLLDFPSRKDASTAAASLISTALDEALHARGAASIAVSGGTTPTSVFRNLSRTKLDWGSVTVGLVDERFVPPSHNDSNERLVRRTLLQHSAAEATFLPLWKPQHSPIEAAQDSSDTYKQHAPFDFILLGMGTDGHTASWFPGAAKLSDALNPTANVAIDIDALDCSAAGQITQRITLTKSAVCSARHAILLIFGDDKRRIFQQALNRPISEHPIRAAIEGLGQKLLVMWAP